MMEIYLFEVWRACRQDQLVSLEGFLFGGQGHVSEKFILKKRKNKLFKEVVILLL
jgi:hypothetical protein